MDFDERMDDCKVDQNGCWIYAKVLTRIWYGEKQISVPTASYLHYNGEMNPGESVMHTCWNDLCCNPQHLYLLPTIQVRNLKKERTLKEGKYGRIKRPTTCSRGLHPYNPDGACEACLRADETQRLGRRS